MMRKFYTEYRSILLFFASLTVVFLLSTARPTQSSPALNAIRETNCNTVIECLRQGNRLRDNLQLDRAIDAYKQAINLLQSDEDPELMATAYNNLGVALYEYWGQVSGDRENEIWNQAVSAFRDSINSYPLPNSYVNLVGVLTVQRKDQLTPLEERELWDEIVAVYREFEKNVFPEVETIPPEVENEIQYEGTYSQYFNLIRIENQPYYEYYINQLMAALPDYSDYSDRIPPEEIEPGVTFEERALEISERARVRGFLELLVREDAYRIPDEELEQQKRNLDNRARQARTQEELDSIEQEYQTLFNQVRERYPQYRDLNPPRSLTVGEIKQLLDEDTLLLEFSLGDLNSFLWVVSNNDVQGYVLPEREKIEEKAQNFYRHLTEPSYRVRPNSTVDAGRQLSRLILGDAVGQLGNKRLLIVADGWLHYIPFGALPTPESGENDWEPDPLLKKHEIINIPSASALATMRKRVKGRDIPPELLAIVANDELPGALRETEAIRREAEGEYDDINVVVQTDLDREDLNRYRIIHFATHGVLNAKNLAESGLKLSPVNRLDNSRIGNNLLRVPDVFELDLAAGLVVLSGCQTGLGEEFRGEGLVGLTRGFMYAKAERVIVSLWSVNDEATAILMAKFYDELLDHHETAPKALREAQLTLINQLGSVWETPYYWAAFTLQGEWKGKVA